MSKYLSSILCSLLLLCHQATVWGYEYGYQVVDKTFDSIAAQLDQLDFERRLSEEYLPQAQQLARIAEQKHSSILRSRATLWNVRCQQLSLPADSCLQLLEQADQWIDAKEYPYDHAVMAYMLAGYNDRLNQLFKAYQLLQEEVIPYFSQIDDHYRLGCTYHLMSYISRDLADNEEALRYLNLAQNHMQAAGSQMGRLYFAKALLMSEQPDSVSYYLHHAIEADPNDMGTVVQAYVNLTSLALDKLEDDPSQADSVEYYINKGLSLVTEQGGNSMLEAVLLINRGTMYFYQGHYEEALRVCQQIEQLSDGFSQESYTTEVYRLLWKIYDHKGDQKRAYEYLNLYQNAYAERMERSQRAELQRLQVREEIHRQQEAMNQLRQEAELQQRTLYIILLVMLVVLLAIAGLAIYFYQQKRIRKIQNLELSRNLRQEILIKNMQQQNFERDLKQKDCEISSSVLLLANKNEVLQQISQLTRQFSDQGMIPMAYVNQVNSVIGESLKNDDEWDRFKKHFDSVHPGFFTNLKKRFPELTENELRLCAYIRIGLRAKQIAEMLNVTADSVNTSRYRLRKKMNLSKTDNLDELIRNV